MHEILNLRHDGLQQALAGAALLNRSGLIRLQSKPPKFVKIYDKDDEAAFKKFWKSIDPKFGRLICWMQFSGGAEFLLKGVCLSNEIEIRSTKSDRPCYPRKEFKAEEYEDWAKRFIQDQACEGTMWVTDYGTLGGLTGKGLNGSRIETLCKLRKASDIDRNKIYVSYRLLERSIRNRDAHAYIKGAREYHLHLVSELFVDVFNILASWLPQGSIEPSQRMSSIPQVS